MRPTDSVWVDYNGVRGFSDPDEYHEQGSTVPAFPVTDFLAARPKLEDEAFAVPF